MKKIVHDYATEVMMETKEEAEQICRLGQGPGCCAFLTIGVDGFMCVRMSYPLNSSIIRRLAEGSMNAKGPGGWEGCPWKGMI